MLIRLRSKALPILAGLALLVGASAVGAQNSPGGAFRTNFNYILSGQWTWRGTLSPFIFEGAVDDTFETTFSIVEPTADRTFTLPNATSGTFLFSSLSTNGIDAANSVWGASNALVFEGATADAAETSIVSTDVTADRTFTLPDPGAAAALVFSLLTTNTVDAPNAVWFNSNAIVFEGASNDAFELTLSPADVGADRTVTIPDMGAASVLLSSTLTTNTASAANSVWGVSNGLTFEGATADAGELFLTVADIATASRTMTLPDMGAASSVVASLLATNAADVLNSLWGVSNGLSFEGATADAFEITLSPADATADSTATLPNLTGNIVIAGLIAAGSTETVSAVTHAGACIALDTGGGSTITLPAATGTGNRYCFVVTVAGTHVINVVGNDEFVGGIHQGNDSDNTTVFWPAADTADNDRITLNNGSQGGFVGCRYDIVDILTDNWSVIGSCDASGTEATPFATGQVS